MQYVSSEEDASPRALQAEHAGVLLAALIGLPEPITPQRMWRMARAGHIPCVKLGRLVFFRDDELRRFVERGGVVKL